MAEVLDEKGWGDLMGTMEGTLEKVIEIHDESGKRLAKAGAEAEPFDAMVAMAGVEMPSAEQKARSVAKAKGKGKASGKKR